MSVTRLLSVICLALLGIVAQAQTLTSVAASPTTVTGGTHSELIVHLSGNATSNVTVSLTSGAPTVVTLPSTITFNTGSDVATLIFPTYGVNTATAVTLTGKLNGVTQTGTITVNPPTISNAVCSPNTIYGTKYCALYVYLSGPAGSSGLTVSFANNNPSVATVPGSVTIGPGATYCAVTVTSQAVDSQSIATFTASFNGSSKTASLTVNPPILTEVFSSPSSIHAGGACHIWAYLNAPAGPSGITVSLSSNNPGVMTIPSSVTFPAGSLYAHVTGNATGGVDSNTTVGLTATNSLSGNSVNGSMTVTPATLSSMVTAPTSVIGGATSHVYAYLNGPAGPSGVTVNLSSSNFSYASVPTTLSVLAAASNGKAAITTYSVAANHIVTITGTEGGQTATANITVTSSAPTVQYVTLNPTAVIGGGTSTLTVTISAAAPPGGLSVSLNSNDASATVPATVTIPADGTTANATVVTTSVGMNIPVTVSAVAGSGTAVSANLLVESAIGSPAPEFRGDMFNSGTCVGTGANGSVLWSYATGGQVNCAILDGNGNVYIGSDDGNIYQLNRSGVVQWTYQTNFGIVTSLAIGSNGNVYAAVDGDPTYENPSSEVIALNSSGTEQWTFGLTDDAGIASALSIDSAGNIYFGADDDNLYSISLMGTLNWTFNAGHIVSSTPAFGSNGDIYFGCGDSSGVLYAINSSGAQVWADTIGQPISSSPAIGPGGTVYVGCDDGYLFAVNGTTGAENWGFATGGGVESSPAVGPDGTTYFGSDDGNIYAVTAAGTKKWSYETGGPVESSPILGPDGTVYVGCDDFTMYAIKANGALSWKYATGNAIGLCSPIMAFDGVVYIGSSDNSIYAIH